MNALLVGLAVAFAWSMGAHYTGACMGMPRALGAVRPWQALAIMAPLAWAGATLASRGVEHTVADRLTAHPMGTGAQIVVLGVAFALTTAFNRRKVPTSTIQILVFAVAGAALGERVGVMWSTIRALAIVWVSAPLVAATLGFGLTRAIDRVPSVRRQATLPAARTTAGPHRTVRNGALVLVGAGASFVMGGNDVANASGSLVATQVFSPLLAAVVGGGGLAVGVATWGRPLLDRVAFDIVRLDPAMAIAAQAVQAAVVVTAVAFGFFTSLNQALVGAMAGAGAARGRRTVERRVLTGIVRGWVVGPAAGLTAAYLLARAVTAIAGPSGLG